MLEGKARYNINGKDAMLKDGKYLFIDVNNVIQGEFIEPSKIIVVHSPSVPTDKTFVA